VPRGGRPVGLERLWAAGRARVRASASWSLGSDREFDPSATRTAQRRGYVRTPTRGVEGIARRPRPNLRPHAGVTVHSPLLPSGLGILLKFDTEAVSTGTSDVEF
jgi:hypothetical protein